MASSTAELHKQGFLAQLAGAAAAHGAINGGFTLIDFPDPNDPETVYLDSPAGNLYVKKSHDKRRFGQTFSRLRMTALDVEESGQFLQAALKET